MINEGLIPVIRVTSASEAVDVADAIKEGGVSFIGAGNYAMGSLLPEVAGRPGVALQLRVQKHGRDILLRGHLSGEIELTCSRCLERFRYPVAGASTCCWCSC
jgi:hypothetical protein